MSLNIHIENNRCYGCDVSLISLENAECKQCRLEYNEYLNNIGYSLQDGDFIKNFIEYANITKEKFDQTLNMIDNDHNDEIFTNLNNMSKLIDYFDDIACACKYLMNISIIMRKTLSENIHEE